VAGTIQLVAAMQASAVRRLVFSSSATVYAPSATMPLSEAMPAAPTSPYGRSKWMVEELLRDMARADARWEVAILRYFNPVGAHASGLLGEYPEAATNLVPLIAQVAAGEREELRVFGMDYPTPDGTGIRDYVHVMDVAEGHVRALQYLPGRSGAHVWNLGTGHGLSVLEVIRAFEVATGRTVPWRGAPRREGDIAEYWADVSAARRDLGWQATRCVDTMMRDAWRWHVTPPLALGHTRGGARSHGR
jgi:UDP-glucose 4-epimerase